MRMLKIAGLPLALVISMQVQAAALEWQAGLGGDVYWFDWREYDGSGEELLVESGPLALARVDLRMDYRDFYSSLAFGWGGGTVKYDGQLQTGAPYEADAWEEVKETELQLGWQQDWGNLHVGLLQRDWHRTIDGSVAQNVSSAEERYRWRIATVGGQAVVYSSPAWQAALSVDVGVPVMSFQKVYARVYDAFEVEPGDGIYWRIALPLRYTMGEGRSLSIAPYFQYQDMDASNLAPAYRNGLPVFVNGQRLYLYQPASERREGGISLQVSIGG